MRVKITNPELGLDTNEEFIVMKELKLYSIIGEDGAEYTVDVKDCEIVNDDAI